MRSRGAAWAQGSTQCRRAAADPRRAQVTPIPGTALEEILSDALPALASLQAAAARGPAIVKADLPRFEQTSGRLAVGSSELLGELRADVFHSVGPRYGHGVLYGIGFTEGLIDALRVTHTFQRSPDPFAQIAGPALPLLFDAQPGRSAGCFAGALREPIESRLHLERFGASGDPICFVSAGYAAGWYTELLGETVLVRERSCRARGDAECSFEARPLAAWSGDGFIDELVPYLDVSALRARAQASLPPEREPDAEGGLFGSFDPLSPAVHVWGPVMILPYSGADDSAAAIETIMGDVGPDQVRVVIVDVLGMQLDSLELAGLSKVLTYVRSHEMESILVGMPRRQTQRMGRVLDSTLCVDDMKQGIALGFQMVHASTS